MNVLITGAAGGLGRAVSMECARRGYTLFLLDLPPLALSRIKWGIEHKYPSVKVNIFSCDLTDNNAVASFLEETDRSGVCFDMLFNVAGIEFEGAFLNRSSEELVKIVSVNDAAVVRLTHSVLMRRNRSNAFTLVFISSLAALFPMPLKATYGASKKFILDISTALHYELKEHNINVMSVCPAGMIPTQENLTANNAQGIYGELTYNRIEVVSRKMIDLAKKGKCVYIPGSINRFLAFLGKILPSSFAAKYILSRWKKAQSKWLTKADRPKN